MRKLIQWSLDKPSAVPRTKPPQYPCWWSREEPEAFRRSGVQAFRSVKVATPESKRKLAEVLAEKWPEALEQFKACRGKAEWYQYSGPGSNELYEALRAQYKQTLKQTKEAIK